MIAWLAIAKRFFVANFESKQIWKRCCKKSVDHYNAIPSLNIDCQLQVGSATCFLIRLKVTKLSFFSRNCPEPSKRRSVRWCDGARLVRRRARQSRRSPLWWASSPKNKLKLSFPYRRAGYRVRWSVVRVSDCVWSFNAQWSAGNERGKIVVPRY